MDEIRLNHYLIPLFVVILVGIVVLVIWAQSADDPLPNILSKEHFDISNGSLPALGEEESPVKIIIFGDYTCSFCRELTLMLYKELERDFVAPGYAAIFWRDFPSIEPISFEAAHAVRCAHEQGKFREYQELLLAHDSEEQPLNFSAFAAYAERIDLNYGEFLHCNDTNRHSDEIEKDKQEGKEAGVQAAPTLFINGERVVGAQPYEVLYDIVRRHIRGL